MYLLDQEILYHRQADHHRSSISLACYLLSRYRQPSHPWAIWAARKTNYDAWKCVDAHYMWYTASGIEEAKKYVKSCEMEDVVEGAFEDGGRMRWWRELVEEVGDEMKVFDDQRRQVVERLESDMECGVTDDEKVEKFSGRRRRDGKSHCCLEWGISAFNRRRYVARSFNSRFPHLICRSCPL